MEIEDLPTIKRNPAYVRDVLLVYARKCAEAGKIDANVRAAIEQARYFSIAAQHAHKVED